MPPGRILIYLLFASIRGQGNTFLGCTIHEADSATLSDKIVTFRMGLDVKNWLGLIFPTQLIAKCMYHPSVLLCITSRVIYAVREILV
jgi:hypothetical protein